MIRYVFLDPWHGIIDPRRSCNTPAAWLKVKCLLIGHWHWSFKGRIFFYLEGRQTGGIPILHSPKSSHLLLLLHLARQIPIHPLPHLLNLVPLTCRCMYSGSTRRACTYRGSQETKPGRGAIFRSSIKNPIKTLVLSGAKRRRGSACVCPAHQH